MSDGDFPASVVLELGRRVSYICSFPGCGSTTIGPNTRPDKSTNLGEAAHICGARRGTPRYDASQTDQQRASAENGIWLCRKHHALIDKDWQLFSVATLLLWKEKAEAEAAGRLYGDGQTHAAPLVVSHNQTGGQTALTIINNGKPARSLIGRTVASPFLLAMQARKIAPVTIVVLATDSETLSLAKEMSAVLASVGINDGPTEPAIIWGIVGGHTIGLVSSATDPQSDPLLAFAAWLQTEGFAVTYNHGAKGNSIFVPAQE